MLTEIRAVDEMTQRAIEHLLTAFGSCADRADGGGLAELFVNDGTDAACLEQLKADENGRSAAASRFDTADL